MITWGDKMKKFLMIVVSIATIFVIGVVGMIFYLTRGMDNGKDIVINAAIPSSLVDGTYKGKYKAGRWTNELKVTVKEGKISGIEVIDDVTFPKPEWTKQLFDRIIKEQSLAVDVVSGATVTSKAYMKAIEDAFNSNKMER